MPPVKRAPRRRRPTTADPRRRRKVCQFCNEKAEPIDYKNVAMLRKFVSDKGKIRTRRVTGNCGIHQRAVARAVKNAREMALLPYVQTRA